MKTFTQYLYETQKVHEFVIKLANIDVDNSIVDKIKSALEAYSVESISKPKSIPAQKDADFPKLGSCECKLITVGLNYPVVADQVLQVIADRAFVPRSNLCVRTQAEHDMWVADEARLEKREGALLDDAELKTSEDGQELVGANRTSMLKDFETRKYEFASKQSEKGKTLNDEPTGEVSPVGSNQNKKPSPVKGK